MSMIVLANWYREDIDNAVLKHGEEVAIEEIHLLVDECLKNGFEFILINDDKGNPAVFGYARKGKFRQY